MGVLFAALGMVSFGSNILITRVALTRLSLEAGFFIVLAANIVFPGALFAIELAARPQPFVWDWKGAGIFALAGVIGIFLGRRLMFDTVRLLGPSRASVFHSSAPVFAFLGAWLLAGEAIDPLDLVFVAIVWVGLWLTQPSTGGIGQLTAQQARRGLLVGLCAVAGFGLANVLRGIAVRGWDEALFGTALSAVAGLVLHAAVTRDWPKIAGELKAAPRSAWLLYAGCGIATACGSVFATLAMKTIHIGLAVLIVHTTPLLVFPVSALVLKHREELTRRTLVGTVLVLAGIAALVVG
jgi:drug/metabolite transporter (DMT)-like permease